MWPTSNENYFFFFALLTLMKSTQIKSTVLSLQLMSMTGVHTHVASTGMVTCITRPSPQRSLVPFPTPFTTHSGPRYHWSAFSHYTSDLPLSRVSYQWNTAFCVWLCSPSIMLLQGIHVSVMVPFYCLVIFHCIDISRFISLGSCRWTHESFPFLGYYEKSCCHHLCINSSVGKEDRWGISRGSPEKQDQ